MRHRRGEGEKEVGIGTVLVDAEEGGAAQQQWHRSASECAEAPRRKAVKEGGVGRARLGSAWRSGLWAARFGILGPFWWAAHSAL